jgi:hypothetical protein
MQFELEKINPIYKKLRVFNIYGVVAIGSDRSRYVNLRVIGVK